MSAVGSDGLQEETVIRDFLPVSETTEKQTPDGRWCTVGSHKEAIMYLL